MAAAKLRKENLTLSEDNARLKVEADQSFADAKDVLVNVVKTSKGMGLEGFWNAGRADIDRFERRLIFQQDVHMAQFDGRTPHSFVNSEYLA